MKNKIFGFALFILLVGSLSLFAAGTHKETPTDPQEHESPFWSVFWRIIDFLALLIILKWALGDFIKKFFKKRSEDIQTEIENSKIALAEAEIRYNEIISMLTNARKDMEEIVEKGNEEAKKEKELILARAKEEAEVFLKSIQKQIDLFTKEAKQQLKEYTAKLACLLAEQNLKSKLDPKMHSALVEKQLSELDEVK